MGQIKITNKNHPWFGSIGEITEEDVRTMTGFRDRAKIIVLPKGTTYGEGVSPFECFLNKGDYEDWGK